MEEVVFGSVDGWRRFVCSWDVSVVYLKFDEAELWEAGKGVEASNDARKRKRFPGEGTKDAVEGYELMFSGAGKESEKVETGEGLLAQGFHVA